jgi:hypothetical protein
MLYSHINIDTCGFMSFNGFAEFDEGYGLTLYDGPRVSMVDGGL